MKSHCTRMSGLLTSKSIFQISILWNLCYGFPISKLCKTYSSMNEEVLDIFSRIFSIVYFQFIKICSPSIRTCAYIEHENSRVTCDKPTASFIYFSDVLYILKLINQISRY